MSAFETAIEGYGKAGGMWGQLYNDMLGKRSAGEPPSRFMCKP
jgi:hypothetical protein